MISISGVLTDMFDSDLLTGSEKNRRSARRIRKAMLLMETDIVFELSAPQNGGVDSGQKMLRLSGGSRVRKLAIRRGFYVM